MYLYIHGACVIFAILIEILRWRMNRRFLKRYGDLSGWFMDYPSWFPVQTVNINAVMKEEKDFAGLIINAIIGPIGLIVATIIGPIALTIAIIALNNDICMGKKAVHSLDRSRIMRFKFTASRLGLKSPIYTRSMQPRIYRKKVP